MKIRMTLEVLSVVAAHSENLLEVKSPLPGDAVACYWSRMRALQRSWSADLAAFRADLSQPTAAGSDVPWRSLSATLSDIFLMEFATRVWGATLTAIDPRGVGQMFARQVFVNQLEVCQQALQLLVQESNAHLSHIAAVDRLRRRIERWTDLWLSPLMHRGSTHAFAYNKLRALEFATELRAERITPRVIQLRSLYLMCFKNSFSDVVETGPVHRDELRAGIVRSVLACLPPELFAGDGVLSSRWMRTLNASRDKAEGPVSFQRISRDLC